MSDAPCCQYVLGHSLFYYYAVKIHLSDTNTPRLLKEVRENPTSYSFRGKVVVRGESRENSEDF